MNNKKLDALFTGLTGTAKPSILNQSPVSQSLKATDAITSERQSEERTTEERFCSIVKSDIIRKIRIIANREGLQIKDVINAAFAKAIKSYERKHGTVDGDSRGDASNLF